MKKTVSIVILCLLMLFCSVPIGNVVAANIETDINYTLNVDYCGCSKDLFTLYFPDEDAAVAVTCNAINEASDATPTPTPTPTPSTTE